MNKLILLTSVAMFAINISEAWAAWFDNCPSGTTAGTTCKTCGDNCAYTENSKHVVTIYGSGIMNYDYKNVNGKFGFYDANNNPNPFLNNKSITGVQFAEGSNFTSIGDNAFNGASRLTSITIPDSVTSIGGGAFNGARKLTSITIPEGVTSIGNGAFSDASSLTSITIPEGVTSIGSYAFSGASSLTSITIPEGVTSIGSYAFWGATGLTSITIPEGVTSIGGWAFSSASSLTSITIPDSVTSIGDSAFYNASSLTSITLPDSVTSIGSTAFGNTSSLNNIMCKGDATSCAAMVNALPSNLRNKVSYPTDKTSCEGASTSLYVWDGSKCGRRNEEQCNSVAKYYYDTTAGKCKVLPKTQSACQTPLIWLNNKCYKQMPCPSNCGSCDVEGICTECETGYLINGHNCISADKCKNGFHGDNGACVENTVANCNTEINGKCTECNSGLLEQAGACVTSCGAGYKQMENWCNRIQYTPAEAAPLLNDDNNTVTITFRK